MLSILCVTRGLAHAGPFLDKFAAVASRLGAEYVLGTHGEAAVQAAGRYAAKQVAVEGTYLEEMLDTALAACTGDYILRMDDDERISPALEDWLARGRYRKHPGWYFPRVHLWPDEEHFIHTAPFFPDYQGRLAIPSQSSRAVRLHAGPSHQVYPASCAIEHLCFLVKTYEERRLMDMHYKSILQGTKHDPTVIYPVFPEDAVNLDIRSYP